MALPDPLRRLTAAFSKLPGVGRRSGERMALFLAQEGPEACRDIEEAVKGLREKVVRCPECGRLTLLDHMPCTVCADPRRDRSLLCVVEQPGDAELIESARGFTGTYFVLGGKLAAAAGMAPQQLRLEDLVRRVESLGVREILIALGTDTESEATVSLLQEVLAPLGVALSRLAFGLPAGSGLAYADGVTLRRAVEGRQTLPSPPH